MLTSARLWREAYFEVQSVIKNWRVRSTFGRSDVVLRGSRKEFCTLSKMSKTRGFCGIRRGSFLNRIWKGVFRVAGAVQETCSSDSSEMLGGQGADFLRGGAFWIIRSSGLLRWFLRHRCGTSYDLASLFRGSGNAADRWSAKIAKRIATRPSALHSTVHFWRKSRRIASVLLLSTSKIEEVSQNSFAFDVVKVKNEEVSQNCCVFDVAKLKFEDVSQKSFVFNLADR